MNIIGKFKLWLRKNRNSQNRFLRFAIGVFDDAVAFFRTIRGLLTSKNSRAIFYMKYFEKDRVHQTNADTRMNRFPQIFNGCKEYFGDQDHIRILSFGCATGEEVLTLRNYFPNAEIVGAEINKNSLRICRELPVDEKIHFIDSVPEVLQKYAPYDAIFCMAVFQRTPSLIAQKDIKDLSKIYPFEKFESQIEELDGYLKQNGLFIVHFSHYDFFDTDIAEKYTPYGDYNQNGYGEYVFDRNSKLKETRPHRYSIYKKER